MYILLLENGIFLWRSIPGQKWSFVRGMLSFSWEQETEDVVLISHLEPSVTSGPRRNTDTDFSAELHPCSQMGALELVRQHHLFHPNRIPPGGAGVSRNWVSVFLYKEKCEAIATSWRVAWGVRQEGRASWLVLRWNFQGGQGKVVSWGSLRRQRWGFVSADVADRCPGSEGCSWPSTPYIFWLSASDHPAAG